MHIIIITVDLCSAVFVRILKRAQKLSKPRCNSVRTHFFNNRILGVWNSVPENVTFSSLGAFKRSVRTVDLSKFIKCNSN